MFSNSWPPRGPSQEDITTPVYDIDQFHNSIPQVSEKPHYYPLTRAARHGTDATSTASVTKQESKFRALFWPAIAICVPIALLSVTLLALVFAYRVTSEPSIFKSGNATDDSNDKHDAYVLVNFSATRLVFAASFLSTVAPLLASFIMTLWSLIASANMRQASSDSHFENLPTPYQLSLLVGVCLASIEQLRSFLGYALSRQRRTRVPPVLTKAATIFSVTICLASGVFVADTALHYLTSTIVFDHITTISPAERASGFGLSALCLNLDRVGQNAGFPCSMPFGLGFEDPDRTARRNEMYRLMSNASSVSQIRWTGASGLNDTDVAVMIPNPAVLGPGDDFRASTVGVAASCQLVPPSVCAVKAIGDDNINTQFNCSDNFFGVLGKSPNISSANGEKAIDPDLSPLGFKPAVNLQFAYFNDTNLSTIYNPESWDPETNQPDELNIIPDDQLLNPFFVSTAARVAVNTFTATSNITTDEPDVFNSENGFLDLIMTCTVTSYSVNYTWYKSSIRNVTVEQSENGTLLEIFHGTQTYNTVGGGAFDLQQYLVDSAIAGNDTAAFLTTFGNQYSLKVLSLVGAYLSPRTNLEEQGREALLVAKVPKAALGALIACSLIYTVLGIFLVISAYRASSESVSLIAEQLSLAGLTNMAFGEGKAGSPSTTTTPRSRNDSRRALNDDDYFARLPRRETRRVRISGTDFRVWV